jgi:hypothetical protein
VIQKKCPVCHSSINREGYKSLIFNGFFNCDVCGKDIETNRLNGMLSSMFMGFILGFLLTFYLSIEPIVFAFIFCICFFILHRPISLLFKLEEMKE